MTRKVIVDVEAMDRKIAGSIDYNRTAFFMKKPCSNKVVDGPFQIKNKSEHRLLISIAIEKKLYLWYSAVTQRDDKMFIASPMMIVDWDTVPSPTGVAPTPPPVDANGQQKVFRCPCGKVCTSTPGLTLHQKRCPAMKESTK